MRDEYCIIPRLKESCILVGTYLLFLVRHIAPDIHIDSVKEDIISLAPFIPSIICLERGCTCSMERSSSSASIESSFSNRSTSPVVKKGFARRKDSTASLSQMSSPTSTRRTLTSCVNCGPAESDSLLSEDRDLKGLKNVRFISMSHTSVEE